MNRREHFFVTILRFQVYNYYPAGKEFYENINYYWIETTDKSERAIFGCAWFTTHWKSREVMCYHRMMVRSGDSELFSYLKQILLLTLYEQKEQEFIERGYDLTLKK